MSRRERISSVEDVIGNLRRPKAATPNAPVYTGSNREPLVMLSCESMSRHTADAGHQMQEGLRHAGYELHGHGYPKPFNNQNVNEIIEQTNPGTLVIQDKREWEGRTAGQNDKSITFRNVECLQNRDDMFKVTVLKDAHHKTGYHHDSAVEMGVHAWVIYYHPTIVKHVAPYIRLEHCIRTSHSVNADDVPDYNSNRLRGCLLSGAVSVHYPLRRKLVWFKSSLPLTDYLAHPGYQHRRCHTPNFLKKLSMYRVAICTSSRYGYSLRKIVEASACGCVVVTDLPVDDVVPVIDYNLIRVPSNITPAEVAALLEKLYRDYDPDKQEEVACKAKNYYDYRAVGERLAMNIEEMRQQYYASVSEV